MAGIFVNVNDDIQSLRNLKNEIIAVKNALKSININVDLNIKEGLEAQLRSLTLQYDALASKISETEGKIQLSIQRINESTQKIIEAQEKLVGSSQGQSVTQQQTAATATETASVQAQAKAYDDLKAEIDAVLGSRSENVRRMVEEQNAIRLINLELKQMEKQSVGGNYSPAQLKRIEQLNSALLTHKTALAEVRQVLNNNAKIDNAAANSMARLSQELGRMRMAFRELTEEEKKSPFGQELLATINEADAKIKSFDASIGNFQRNVGNYGSAFNGLGMSVQQIVRELPSASIGLNTFFMAVSNNIPILVDEIKRAKLANEALKKSGESTVPVWKQVASSLFSWQTALMVGISALTMYGDDIIEWVGKLFSGKSAVDDLRDAQENLNKTFMSDTNNIGVQISLITKLSNVWVSLGNNMEDQEQFIKENQENFDNLGVSIQNVSDAENLLITNTQAFINAMVKRAKAQAGMKLAAESSEKSLLKQMEIEKELAQGITMGDKAKAALANWGLMQSGSTQRVTAEDVFNERINKMREEQKELDKLAASYVQLNIAQENQANQELENAGIKETDNSKNQQIIKQHEDLALVLRNIQQQNLKDEIALEEDAIQKRLKQIEFDYNQRIRAYEEAKTKLGDVEEVQQMKINADKFKEQAKAELKAEEDARITANNEALIRFKKLYGDYQERKEAIMEEYALKIQKARIDGVSDDENGNILILQKQQEKELEELDNQFKKETLSMADLFEDASNKSVKSMQAIIDKYDTLVKFMSEKDSGISEQDLIDLGFSEEDIARINAGEINVKELTDKLKELKGELADRSPWQMFRKNLDEALGQKELGAKISGIGRAVNQFAPAMRQFSSDLGNIFGFDDAKIQSAIDGVEGLGTAAEGVGQIFAGDIVGGSMKAVSGISQVVDAFEGLFGADYTEYNRMVEEYSQLEAVWNKIIAKKKEYIDISYGDEARKAADEAAKILQSELDSLISLGLERLNSGASIGSHSIGVRQRKSMNEEAWAQLRKAANTIGFDYSSVAEGRMEGLFSLTAEQLVQLREQAPLFWAKLDDDVEGYLDKIIECNDEITQMKDTMQETFTNITFESFYDNFVSMITDMSSTSKDFVDDFGKNLETAILSNLMANKYKAKIQQLYDEWVLKSDSDGDGIFDLTNQESQELKAAQKALAEQMIAERNAMAESFGWSDLYSQEASSKGFATMSQDSANELNGRFAASQVAIEESRNQLSIMNATMNDLKSQGAEYKDSISGIQDILASSYIELVVIGENTGETVKCLKVIQSDIAQVKENTKNL